MEKAPTVHDLRSALALLKAVPGQLIETDEPVNPFAEISGVYRHVGAGGTVARPTRKGPAMIFNKVKGHETARVAIGLLASRERVALLLNSAPERLGFLLKAAVLQPIAPVTVSPARAVCQEMVHYAGDPDFDIRALLPAPTNTVEDAGP